MGERLLARQSDKHRDNHDTQLKPVCTGMCAPNCGAISHNSDTG